MTTAAKGGFPGCPRKKAEKRKVLNRNRNTKGRRWVHSAIICDQVRRNLRCFHEVFGASDEDDEFHGFSSEECGLRAYKRISGAGTTQIPDILCSPIDLNKKKVTTRLAHARNSLEVPPSSHHTRRRKRALIRRRYSNSEVRIVDGSVRPSHSLVRLTSPGDIGSDQASSSGDHGFTKYKNSKLDFHRLSKSMVYGENVSTSLSNPVVKLHKTSPIKPATFIAPSMAHAHHVTNVTPTCLKIKLNKESCQGAGPGHPKVLAKALLARANKKARSGKGWDMDPPLQTSTPVSASQQSTKRGKLFVLPAKSSRSSRIIKANRRYIDDYPKMEASSKEAVKLDPLDTSRENIVLEKPLPVTAKSDFPSPSKSRPLLKEATFRVAALANINNKPLPVRNIKDKNLNARMRARKLIKRARFKHPTSSSTLVVGNDFEDELEKKKNLIKEATFKAPNPSKSSLPGADKDELSDLGLSRQEWERLKGDPRNGERWTKQEVHNILHGANTFSNSWTSLARHYEYLPSHRDWGSVRVKALMLMRMGVLSKTLKVKSSILLQLKPRYSDNPNITVMTPYELRLRGLTENVECNVSSGGRLRAIFPGERRRTAVPPPLTQGTGSIEDESKSVYLGFSKENFSRMCMPRIKNSKSAPWSAREIHNVLHGIHVFGVGEWSKIREMYLFHKSHDNLGIRGRFKSVNCRGLVVAGKLRPDILPLLQPKFSAKGKKFFKLSKRKQGDQDAKNVPPTRKRKMSKENGDSESLSKRGKPSDKNQNGSSAESDITSPTRKQAYHLFGAAPVWDEGSAGPALDSLDDNSDRDSASTPVGSVSPRPATEGTGSGAKSRMDSATHETEKETKEGHSPETLVAKGPRIKHVCRRASLVTGLKAATYSDSDNPQLSALPKEERERIAAEVERLRGLRSDTSASSDDELDTPLTLSRKQQQLAARREKARVNLADAPRTKMKGVKAKRCHSCKTCKAPKCGKCATCRNRYQNAKCLGRQACLYPRVVNDENNPIVAAKSTVDNVARTAMATKREDRTYASGSSSDTMSQRASQFVGSTGVILSPDSRHHIQCELHERDQRLPAVIKTDQWKERYEIDDVWKMGGVSLITSTTPCTRFLCYLCGSVGRARPVRRTSSNSDSSFGSDTVNIYPLFIFCSSCCEAFHPFCLEDHEQQDAITAARKSVWVCKRCRCCNVCGRPDDLLECRRCNKTYHSECLGPSYPTKPSKNRVWVCMRCVRCRSCGASKPGRRPGSKWTHDFQLCQRCGDLFDKGNFCPICRRCYRDEDYDTRMVQCGPCKRWVHSRCESLTVEMYTLLSHLPDDVQYVCPECDGRKSKVELQLSQNDGTMTDESSTSESVEGDKMRGLLCKLPAPSWKKIIEQEVQSGIEKVMMALFHNKEAACVLKRSTVEEDSDRPSDLFTVRFAVHNHKYASVAQFSSDVCAILDTVVELPAQVEESRDRKGRKKRTGARAAFYQEMHEIFPWFDIDTGRVRDSSDVPDDLLPNATLPPHPDHAYAQWQDRDISIRTGGPDTPIKHTFASESPKNPDDIGMVLNSITPRREVEDIRQCLFCGKYGDDYALNAERLLYCGQDEWVHVNCALWSAEVFERHDGSLQNVHSAVSRGKMMKCELCRLPGATVGCNTRDCPQNYHFSCAKLAGCIFQEDKKVFCARHLRHVDGEVVPDDGFEVSRRVVVDNDEMRLNKRWQRGVHSHDITVLMGSTIIHQLGRLAPSSDSRDYLVPVNFRMTRIFWSAVHAGRRVRYTITVTEQKPSVDSDSSSCNFGQPKSAKIEGHGNRTISHADEEKGGFISPPKQPFLSHADKCRSKLVDRMHPVSKVLERRKSQDHNISDLAVQRSRRFSGSSYTVVGSVNRTLPQTITPLPKITTSSGAHHRLLPTVTVPLDEEPSQHDIATKDDDVANTKGKCPDKRKPSSGKVDMEVESAVKVSLQNPYLNLQPRVTGSSRNTPSSTLGGAANDSNLNPILSGYIENTYNKSNTQNMRTPLQTAIVAGSSGSALLASVDPLAKDLSSSRSHNAIIDTLSLRKTAICENEQSCFGSVNLKTDAIAVDGTEPYPTIQASKMPNDGYDVTDGVKVGCTVPKFLPDCGISAEGSKERDQHSCSTPAAEFVKLGAFSQDEVSKSKDLHPVHTPGVDLPTPNPLSHELKKGVAKRDTRKITNDCDKDEITSVTGAEGNSVRRRSHTELRVAVCRLPDAEQCNSHTPDATCERGSSPVLGRTRFSKCPNMDVKRSTTPTFEPGADADLKRSTSPVLIGRASSEMSPPVVSMLEQAKDACEKESKDHSSGAESTASKESGESAQLWWKRPGKNSTKSAVLSGLPPVPASALSFGRGRRRSFKCRKSSDTDEDYDYQQETGRPVWRRSVSDPRQSGVRTRSKSNSKETETSSSSDKPIKSDSDTSSAQLRKNTNKNTTLDSEGGLSSKSDRTHSHSSSLLSTTDESMCGLSQMAKSGNTKTKAVLRKFARNSANAEEPSVNIPNGMPLTAEDPHPIVSNGHVSDLDDGLLSTNTHDHRQGVKHGKHQPYDTNTVPNTEGEGASAKNLRVGRKSNSPTKKYAKVRQKRTFNGIAHYPTTNESQVEKETPTDDRRRSKSMDCVGKKKQKSQSKEIELLMLNSSKRRYPRRNTLTCLKSFSGLSPEYAIQSYASDSYGRRERANARSIKNQLIDQEKSKSKIGKVKRSPKMKSQKNMEDDIDMDASGTENAVHEKQTEDEDSQSAQACSYDASLKSPITCVKKRSTKSEDKDTEGFDCSSSSNTTLETSSERTNGAITTKISEASKEIDDDMSDAKVASDASFKLSPETQTSENTATLPLVKVQTEETNSGAPCPPLPEQNATAAASPNKKTDIYSFDGNSDGPSHSEEKAKNFSQFDKPADSENLANKFDNGRKLDQCEDSTAIDRVTEPFNESCSNESSGSMTADCTVRPSFQTGLSSAKSEEVVSDIPDLDMLLRIKHKSADEQATSIKGSCTEVPISRDIEPLSSILPPTHSSALEDESYTLSCNGKLDTGTSPQETVSSNSFEDSIETCRGIIEDEKSLNNVSVSTFGGLQVTPEKQDALSVFESPAMDYQPEQPLLTPPTLGQVGVSTTRPVYQYTECDIETPLSPRDEPKLPLPMETDAGTAPFLVTSECPVLNADEVQSLLAMPPTTVSCSASPEVSTSVKLPPIPQEQVAQTTPFRTPLIQDVRSTVKHPSFQPTPGGVAVMPINYSPIIQQVPVVVYERPFSPTYSQQPTVPYAFQLSGNRSNQVIVSPPGTPSVAYQQTYAMTTCGQLVPVMISNVPQPTQFITSPTRGGQQVLLNTVPYQEMYVAKTAAQDGYVSVPVTYSPGSIPNVIRSNTAVVASSSALQQHKPSHAINSPSGMGSGHTTGAVKRQFGTNFARLNYSEASNPSVKLNQKGTGHPLRECAAATQSSMRRAAVAGPKSGTAGKTEVKLADDQARVLEEMIEFYSNKNKLSVEEKAMVRAIISEQIQNKSLPMPTLANQQDSCTSAKGLLASGSLTARLQSGPQWPRAAPKPAILHAQRRHESQRDDSPIPSKRQKRKRKEKHVPKTFEPTSSEIFTEADGDTLSPLLNVYLTAVQAEHADNKIAKKWRSAIRSLARNSIHIDVPWSSRRGHRGKENRLPPPPQTSKRSHLVFEITSEDGYHAKGPDLQDLISGLLDAVQECHSNARFPHSALCLASVVKPHSFLGVSHDAIRFLVEQLPGARHCLRYRAKYHKHREPPEEVITHINPHGCARAEKYQGRSKPDMFSFLASKHRVPPTYDPARSQNVDMQQNSTRRATSMDLPMAMRFRHLRTFAREAVGVYRSAIHGRGLYCKRDIEAGEMVMEYTGEVIRCFLTDRREKMYEKKGIGCYMFRMDDMYVVDATMMGSGARFINHSCEPSCYSRIVHIDGKKHIVIFALRKICRGEELTYDYKFPIEAEDQKISCNCGAKTCRRFMN